MEIGAIILGFILARYILAAVIWVVALPFLLLAKLTGRI